MDYDSEETYDTVIAYKKELQEIQVNLEKAIDIFVTNHLSALIFLGKERFQDMILKGINKKSSEEDLWD